mgnify:CR=1 FL=1
MPIVWKRPRVTRMIETIRVKSGFFRFDRVVALVVFGYGMIAAVIPDIFFETVLFTASAMVGTAPFITSAVLAAAYLKATGAEALVASAFKGAHLRMILFASLLGGLSPLWRGDFGHRVRVCSSRLQGVQAAAHFLAV